MMMHKSLLYLSIIAVFCACNVKQNNAEAEEIHTSELSNLVETEEISYDLIYEGILPCKDCGGIKTTLKLSTTHTKFSLKEEFLNTEIAPNVILGDFNTEKGYEQDENATLYILNSELPDIEHIYFVRLSTKASTLIKLDSEKKMTAHTNFELKKVQ